MRLKDAPLLRQQSDGGSSGITIPKVNTGNILDQITCGVGDIYGGQIPFAECVIDENGEYNFQVGKMFGYSEDYWKIEEILNESEQEIILKCSGIICDESGPIGGYCSTKLFTIKFDS